jgi:hypothetical protein
MGVFQAQILEGNVTHIKGSSLSLAFTGEPSSSKVPSSTNVAIHRGPSSVCTRGMYANPARTNETGCASSVRLIVLENRTDR